ncbi:MAG: aminotransferase class V-fold PLP-dependent enzyme [Ignavibacteriales bacterium]|nr:aminotransferase class V-fold PLP-dependent enzyme [Ignavibacteriales bacterium]
MNASEQHFSKFRNNIIGLNQKFLTPYGEQRIVYADWTASGRLYAPIERTMSEDFGPFVGNTHSEANVTGTSMTQAYHKAHDVIKRHVNAGPDDALLFVGFGMTAAINKLQRILGLKIPEQVRPFVSLPDDLKPVVFVTHMEHHSNHTTWYETMADVHVLRPTPDGQVDLDDLRELLKEYKNRKFKIGSFTACSNVTGVETPYRELARIMHENGGVCFVDFAASAPYANIDMHPSDPMEKLDAVILSPHKFLGGPGTSGVLIFDSNLYQLQSPDQPGGGTVLWTNPWGKYRYHPNIEIREDGGTPGFLQAIKAALAFELKEEMGMEELREREEEMVSKTFQGLRQIPGLHILADNLDRRIGIISFFIDNVHYNLVVKLLNDRFGVQVRGGCSCAGTYGHYLLHLDKFTSKRITDRIDEGDFSARPGWVRMSLHPTTTDEEVDFIIDAVRQIQKNANSWERDYTYDSHMNEYRNRNDNGLIRTAVEQWFDLSEE